MAADPQMWKAFRNHLRKMISELEAELAGYESGTFKVSRRVRGADWEDITQARAEQIRREIASIQHTLERYEPRA